MVITDNIKSFFENLKVNIQSLLPTILSIITIHSLNQGINRSNTITTGVSRKTKNAVSCIYYIAFELIKEKALEAPEYLMYGSNLWEALNIVKEGYDFRVDFIPGRSGRTYTERKTGTRMLGSYDHPDFREEEYEYDEKIVVPDVAPVFRVVKVLDRVDSDASQVGGIDMNRINLDRKGRGIDMEMDPVLMQDILTNGVDGFVPVILDLTPISSVLPLLGLNPEQELGPADKPQELALFSMN